MVRKLAITLAAFALVCAVVLGAGALAEPATALRPVEAASPCPATGCASGECHGFDAVPGPDGAHDAGLRAAFDAHFSAGPDAWVGDKLEIILAGIEARLAAADASEPSRRRPG